MPWRTPQSNLTTPEYGERWGDALGDIQVTGRTGFTEEAYRDTGHLVQFTKHNLDSTIQGKLQLDHDWELDTEIRLHLHLLPMANGAGDTYWTFSHFLCPIGVALPAIASWTTSTIIVPLIAADQYIHRARTLFVVTPSGGTPSSIWHFNLARESTNILDTYSTNKDHGTAQANLGVTYVDAHYRKASPGTGTEWA